MDIEGQIANPTCAYHLTNLRFDLFMNHISGEDTFQVIDSGLYFQFTPLVHHFPKFISWLTAAYLDWNNYFVSNSRTKILEITPKLIQKSKIFPISPTMQSFIDVTLTHHFVTPPSRTTIVLKKNPNSGSAILAPCRVFLSYPLPWTYLVHYVCNCVFIGGRHCPYDQQGRPDTFTPNYVASLFSRYLILPIYNHMLPDSSLSHHFLFMLLFTLILLVYVHPLEELDCLCLIMISRNKQRNFVFDWNISIKRRPNIGGYSQFISTYMAIEFKIIHGTSPPRILAQQKELLQLSKYVMVGD